MGTADEQRRRRVGARRECHRRAGVLGRNRWWWDDGTDEESRVGWGRGDEEGAGWRGKTLLLDCVAAPEHCPVPLQHSSASSPFV